MSSTAHADAEAGLDDFEEDLGLDLDRSTDTEAADQQQAELEKQVEAMTNESVFDVWRYAQLP